MKEYIFSRPDEADNTVKRDANYRGELIRCKNCYFYGEFQRKHYCTKYNHTVKQDGFCAWAEPKEDA